MAFLLASMLMFATSCRQDSDMLLLPGSQPFPQTLTEQFDIIWRGIDNNYVFWEVDTTDWDAVYERFRPQFEELDKQETVATDDLTQLYDEMCSSLIDHHMVLMLKNIKAGPDEANDVVYVDPGGKEVMGRDDYHLGISYEKHIQCIQKMDEAGRISHAYNYYAPGNNLGHIISNVIDGDVLYLNFGGFFILNTLQTALDNPQDKMLQGIVDTYYNYFGQLTSNPDIKSVIIDIRTNGGGMLLDMLTVLGPLLKEDLHIFDSKTKMGLGRLDYGEWIPWIAEAVSQQELGKLIKWEADMPDSDFIGDRNVVILTDCYSVSMAEMTAAGAGLLPYVTIIGERTFGGTGTLTTDVHNSFDGQFGDLSLETCNYFVYTCTNMLRTSYGEIIEGKGVTPDIEVILDEDKIVNQHVDNQLEYAVDYLHGKSGF